MQLSVRLKRCGCCCCQMGSKLGLLLLYYYCSGYFEKLRYSGYSGCSGRKRCGGCCPLIGVTLGIVVVVVYKRDVVIIVTR